MINTADKENQRTAYETAPQLLGTYCHFAAIKEHLFS